MSARCRHGNQAGACPRCLDHGGPVRQYVVGVLVAVDQLANAILAGNPDRTLSARLGRAHLLGTRWTEPARRLVDAVFLKLTGQRHHCRDAIEWEETRPDLWNWNR